MTLAETQCCHLHHFPPPKLNCNTSTARLRFLSRYLGFRRIVTPSSLSFPTVSAFCAGATTAEPQTGSVTATFVSVVPGWSKITPDPVRHTARILRKLVQDLTPPGKGSPAVWETVLTISSIHGTQLLAHAHTAQHGPARYTSVSNLNGSRLDSSICRGRCESHTTRILSNITCW